LPLSLADEAKQGWPQGADSWPNWEKGVESLIACLAFRQELRREIISPQDMTEAITEA
jgi:hypothetical protein